MATSCATTSSPSLRAEIEAAGQSAGLPGHRARRRRQAQPDLRAQQAQEGRRGRHAVAPSTRSPATSARPRSKTPSLHCAPTPACTGSSCQLPLPGGLDPEAVLDLMPAEKDVDGLTEASHGSPRPRPARARAVHAAGRDAPAAAIRHPHGRQAGRRRRPVDAGRPSHGAAAGPQGRRRNRHRWPIRERGISSRSAARPTSSSPLPVRRG